MSLDHSWPDEGDVFDDENTAWSAVRPTQVEAPRSSTNAARPATSFVGRRRDLAALATAVDGGARLVTIVGPGGAGKTRLAHEYLRAELTTLQRGRPGGVWFCDLTEVRSSDGICAALSSLLGIPLGAGKTSEDHVDVIERALAARGRLLVVLDNFEQLVDFSEATVGRWLSAVPQLSFVATSRSPLRLQKEITLDLEPLSLPERGRPALEAEAVQLFVERAKNARAGFEPSARDLESIAKIVRRLDGIPLAIELAASRMRVLGAAQIEHHLSHRFQLLVDRDRGTCPRQATLRGTLDWSWELLDSGARLALAQCSVFRGGFDLEAAQSVLDLGPDAPWALDVVQALIEQSLVQAYEPGDDATLRYRLYESVRQYAAERLDELGQTAATQKRHARYFSSLARALRDEIDGRGARSSFRRLELEHENLIAMHKRAIRVRAADSASWALDAAVALEPLLRSRGPIPSLLRLLDEALELLDGTATVEIDNALVARAVLARGHALAELGQSTESGEERSRARELARSAGDRLWEGRALASIARHAWHCGHIDDADGIYAEALAIHREAGDRAFEGRVLSYRANLRYMQGSTEEARRLYAEALRILRSHGDPQSEAITLGNLGSLEHDLGRYEEARVLYEEALAILRGIGDRYNEGNYVMNLGTVALERGDFLAAREAYEQSLRIQREVGNRRWEGIATGFLALCEEHEGNLEAARRRHHEADQLLRDYGHPVVRALIAAGRGRMEADADNLEDAQAWLDLSQRIMKQVGPTIVSAVPRICLGHLHLARARMADIEGRAMDADRYRDEVRDIAESFDSVSIHSADVRLALTRLLNASAEQGQPTLVPPSRHSLMALPERRDLLAISAHARAFRVPGKEAVDLSTRRAPRRILAALVDHREAYPGIALGLDELLAAGWPGEKLLPEAGATRVYTAIATLRRMGLKPYLLRGDDGYLLDPAVPMVRMEESG
ncbi:MAG: tetratricopeptide repeat protein [Myxococcales bacterium]|nr:tetratricopeptide repeat protein [Myxococcales bacterium]